ncbi:MAG TPA: hypothetical protein ENI79_03330 [Rhodospirillales bacterium]|nr:hypothetical protein [Rhodospirillales bacterium]
MTKDFFFSLSALAAIAPLSLIFLRRAQARDGLYWAFLGLATLGPLAWVMVHMSGTWRTDLSMTLWVNVAATMVMFSALAVLTLQGWRLAPLLAPYMMGVGVLATIWQQAPHRGLADAAPTGWIEAHIIVSVATYGLLTLAAVSALAAFLQERALKNKRPTSLTHQLPSIADCELLLVRLLALCEIVLGLGLATGMATQYGETGALLLFDHKTVLTITVFIVIGGLLAVHYRSGVRGRMAARLVLLSYLLLTLGYPGVKFVTDVLMA